MRDIKLVRPTEPGSLIRSVRVSKPQVKPGESVQVQVVPMKIRGENVRISVNGRAGDTHWLSFEGKPGKRRISIVAQSSSGAMEYQCQEVEVLEAVASEWFPKIGLKPLLNSEYEIEFRVSNATELNGMLTYEWDFGEGNKVYTLKPSVIHSYKSSMEAAQAMPVFQVEVKVLQNNVAQYTGYRTVSLVNLHAFQKLKGLVYLPATYESALVLESNALSGKCVIHNPDKEQTIVLTDRLIEYIHAPGTTEGRRFSAVQKLTKRIEILPGQSAEVDCSQPFNKTFPTSAQGFAVHFRGHTLKGSEQVRTAAYFEWEARIKRTERVPANHPVRDRLNLIRNGKTGAGKNRITLSELENTQSTELPSNPGSGTVAGSGTVPSVFTKFPLIQRPNTPIFSLLNLSYQPREGDLCEPEMTNYPSDLVCQLTDEWDWMYVPGRILNARKGDTILSSAGAGLIGSTLASVQPSQYYSHSGIMIEDYYRLRHSTAAEDWLAEEHALRGFTQAGSDGFVPDKLRHIWPGTINQTIDETVAGSEFTYTEQQAGRSTFMRNYTIKGFNPKIRLANDGTYVLPLVVKPDPFFEAENPWVRENIVKIADEVAKINGHYRFFCYTDASISKGDNPAFNAPDRGADWWGSKTLPTVCSSVIWAAAKRLKDVRISLESTRANVSESDLEPTDRGVEAGPAPGVPDGLYFYSEEERKVAAAVIYDFVYNQVYETAGAVGEFFTDAPDDTASQMTNTFAFDWVDGGSKNSKKWKNPGTGKAVSPEDILSWDFPSKQADGSYKGIYGYHERYVYIEGVYEYRQVSRLVKIPPVKIPVKGRVTNSGQAVNAASVVVAGQTLFTDRQGRFSVELPEGRYVLNAHKVISDMPYSGTRQLTVSQGMTEEIHIPLSLPERLLRRKLKIETTLKIKDVENIGKDKKKTFTKEFEAELSPTNPTVEFPIWITKFDGEIRVEVRISARLKMPMEVQHPGIEVKMDMKFFEGTTTNTTDLEDQQNVTLFVLHNDVVQYARKLKNEDGDYADLQFTVRNSN